MGELHDLTAWEQCEALRRRDVGAVELLEHYLARVHAHGAQLGAFVTLDEGLARKDAERAEGLLASGDAGGVPPLTGLPMAFKDLHPVAGVRTTFGSAALADHVPAADGHVVGLLRRAGVVTLGTTHAPEFGPTCFTESAVVERPAVTPYDTSRYASGSSGGAAAAVAAGLLPAAHASDGAGSTRSPAAVCGLVGVKASRGRVSLGPSAGFASWGSEGPVARTVLDAALLLDVMAHPPTGDLYALTHGTPFVDAARRDPERPLRVLRWTDPGRDLQVDKEVARAVDVAAALLRDLGHEVVDGTCPRPWDDALFDAMVVASTTGLAATVDAVVPLDRLDLLQPYTRWSVQRARRSSAVDLVSAMSLLARAAAAHLEVEDTYDAVLTPVTTRPAVTLGWFHEQGPDEVASRMLGWSAYTPWANLTGRPALSVPLHATPEGLPVGIQLTARRGDDALLLSLAGQVERAAPFVQRHPPQWASAPG